MSLFNLHSDVLDGYVSRRGNLNVVSLWGICFNDDVSVMSEDHSTGQGLVLRLISERDEGSRGFHMVCELKI